MSPTTRLLCPLPSCTWGVEELGAIDQDTGEAPVEVEAGGRYMTPAHLSTIAQAQADIGYHMDAHKLDKVPSRPQQSPAQESRSKPAKLDRPRMEIDMTESEWEMFLAEWGRYLRSCRVTEE